MLLLISLLLLVSLVSLVSSSSSPSFSLFSHINHKKFKRITSSSSTNSITITSDSYGSYSNNDKSFDINIDNDDNNDNNDSKTSLLLSSKVLVNRSLLGINIYNNNNIHMITNNDICIIGIPLFPIGWNNYIFKYNNINTINNDTMIFEMMSISGNAIPIATTKRCKFRIEVKLLKKTSKVRVNIKSANIGYYYYHYRYYHYHYLLLLSLIPLPLLLLLLLILITILILMTRNQTRGHYQNYEYFTRIFPGSFQGTSRNCRIKNTNAKGLQ